MLEEIHGTQAVAYTNMSLQVGGIFLADSNVSSGTDLARSLGSTAFQVLAGKIVASVGVWHFTLS